MEGSGEDGRFAGACKREQDRRKAGDSPERYPAGRAPSARSGILSFDCLINCGLYFYDGFSVRQFYT